MTTQVSAEVLRRASPGRCQSSEIRSTAAVASLRQKLTQLAPMRIQKDGMHLEARGPGSQRLG